MRTKVRLTNLILLIAAIFFVIASAGWSAGLILPKTGQTKCYDSAGIEIACTGTGQDGEFQAGVAMPSPRFSVTYCDASGPCADQSSDCDSDAATDVVQDNLTGLMWARVDIYHKNWTEALTIAGNSSLGGYSDWRVPNLNELESLFDAGETYPAAALNLKGFALVHFNRYWTSTWTTDKYDNDLAWAISYDGYISTPFRSGLNEVIIVRGDTSAPAEIWKTGQIDSVASGDDGDLEKGIAWPDPRFTDNGNGTVTDNLTGLVWLKNANCIMTAYPGFDSDGKVEWQQALNFIAGINNGTYSACGAGFTDWRLPNKKELYSLTDFSRMNPAIQTGHPFSNVLSWRYWSSSTWLEVPDQAWVIDMFAGDFYSDYKTGGENAVWPVRGGILGDTGGDEGDGDSSGGGCFIATAAYESPLANEVNVLRQFRDGFLLTNKPGRAFVRWYYRFSPPVAEYMAESEALKLSVRLALTPIVYSVKYPLALVLVVFLCGVTAAIRLEKCRQGKETV